MTISRLTVDKLGVKLYDRVSAVIAEIIANSYDADATEVVISAPMGELLANKVKGKIHDRGFSIEVSDNGSGMTASEVNAFYLKVGAERRTDPRRGDISSKFQRRVMGRKGVGKLAPLGVCEKIEVITSGGEETEGADEHGNVIRGYVTAHLILERSRILNENEQDAPYYPLIGQQDEIIRRERGTIIRMGGFDHRRVPEIADFERQMAQRFGLPSANWRILLRDSQQKPTDVGYKKVVGQFNLLVKADTKIAFSPNSASPSGSRGPQDYRVDGPGGVPVTGIQAGFTLDEAFYPITGWVGYAEKPYKDDLMAGVRIYCRGKIAAQTAVFNIKAGFTGEHDVRSYLIGELHADWLDEGEDLIRTDRQDILWSHDLGHAFQEWGQALVKKIGSITREPMRRSTWERFQEVSKIKDKVAEAFPGTDQEEIRERTMEMAATIAKAARQDELDDPQTVESFVQLSLLLGPHITLDRKLREAADAKDRPLAVVSEVLKTARIAELASFGRIADDRVRVIETLEKLKDAPETLESALQQLLTEAPWLIDPAWSPITANQSFETLKRICKVLPRANGQNSYFGTFLTRASGPILFFRVRDVIQIIEIKRPDHALDNDEMERINKYYELMRDFLNTAGNEEFKRKFPNFHVTLVCDHLNLSGVHRSAFDGLINEGKLEHITWTVFLLRTRLMHQDF